MSKEPTNVTRISNIRSGTSTPIASGGATIQFVRLHEKALLPFYKPGSTCLAIHCCDITESGRDNRITLPSHSISRPIPTGLGLGNVDERIGVLVTPFGLLGAGLLVVNSAALGGPDNGGEIKVCIYNTRPEAARVMHGDHIADLILLGGPHWIPSWTERGGVGDDE